MKKTISFLFLFLITTEFIWGIQQIETVQFPSEDEIAEAFALGEISFDQFLILTELISNKIDASSFLLDEIPQSLLKFDTLQVLDINQTKYFLKKNQKKESYFTFINKYASYIDEKSPSRSQTSINFIDATYKVNLTFKKEYSGRERFTRRYINYTSINKKYTIIAGNFTKRFGLGGIVGYRGKLFSFSDNINTESFLFPDYGGFNGLYIKSNFVKYSLQSVNSFNRNESLSIYSNAMIISTKNKLPSVIIGTHRLKNRDTKKIFSDYKISTYKNFIYNNGNISAELVGETNNQSNSSALLIGGKHKTKKIKFTYSVWNYGKSFLNISGGSKTSLISERITIANVNQEILSKRSNQKGGLLKAQYQLTQNWQMNIASLYAYKNSDTTEMQIFSQLSKKISNSSKLSLDLLYRVKERKDKTNNSLEKKDQSRLMLIQKYDNTYLKNYVLLLHKTDEPSYFGLFSELKYRSENFGLLHLWLNFSRYNINSNQIDYFYGFLKNEIELYDSLSLSFKISHRYHRTASDKQRNQFSIDMSWQI